MAYRILVSPPGIEPTTPALKVANLNHWTTRQVPDNISFWIIISVQTLKANEPPQKYTWARCLLPMTWNSVNALKWWFILTLPLCSVFQLPALSWTGSVRQSYRDFPGGPVVSTSPFNAVGAGLIPDWGAKIPHVLQPKDHSLKQKQYCNKFNKDFKNDPHQKIKLKSCFRFSWPLASSVLSNISSVQTLLLSSSSNFVST